MRRATLAELGCRPVCISRCCACQGDGIEPHTRTPRRVALPLRIMLACVSWQRLCAQAGAVRPRFKPAVTHSSAPPSPSFMLCLPLAGAVVKEAVRPKVFTRVLCTELCRPAGYWTSAVSGPCPTQACQKPFCMSITWPPSSAMIITVSSSSLIPCSGKSLEAARYAVRAGMDISHFPTVGYDVHSMIKLTVSEQTGMDARSQKSCETSSPATFCTLITGEELDT